MEDQYYLKALDLSIPLEANQSIMDHGYVDDVNSHLELVCSQYGLKAPETREAGVTGRTSEITYCDENGKIHQDIYTYYQKGLGTLDNFMTRAHEETHVLQLLGKTQELEKRLEEQGIKLDLSQYNPETVSNIGAIYALLKRGYTLEDIYNSTNGKIDKELVLCKKAQIREVKENGTTR